MRSVAIMALVAIFAIPVLIFADTVTLDPTDDAFIYSKFPDTNYGDNIASVVGYNEGYLSTLLRFDLSSYSGVTVDSASIYAYIYFNNGEYSNIKIGRNIAYWSEDSVTWNNRPGFSGYTSVPYVPGEGWWEIDVTNFIQDFVDGTYENYGFRIGKGDSVLGYVNMYSKESSENERPYLELNYDPNAVECASLGAVKAAFR